MAATAESVPQKQVGIRSASLKRPLRLFLRGTQLLVDPDGTVRALESMKEKRVLFGLEQVWFYKVQAGIVVHAQRPDWAIRASPRAVRMTGRVFDAEVVQTVEFYSSASSGFVRRLKLRNAGQGQLRVRVVELVDPTAAHFSSGRWGSLGVNAFNRDSHVAMDEVSDPPSARVVGSLPSPSRIYMTTGRGRAQEIISSGELPEQTAGMSGQVLVLSAHELDFAPGETKEIVFASLYNPAKLEDVLADFGRLKAGEKEAPFQGPEFTCSEQAVADTSAWAMAELEAGAHEDDLLDRFETLWALTCVDGTLASAVVGSAKDILRKDGSLPHSLDHSKPGVLETAVFLRALSVGLALSQDKKVAKSSYPLVKKTAAFLMSSSRDSTVRTEAGVPQGWRRRLGRGYPTGQIPEVSLAVAAALEAASQVARVASKPDEAGKYLERSKTIGERVRRQLLDDRGFLSLCRDSSEKLRGDETIDMAVSAYRHSFFAPAEQAAAHRLMEKDFDTPYGPRCVPTSNRTYFNGSYGDGQLGGVWPRAVLAHALLCYRAGLAGAGSLELAKVARLVLDDSPKLGGVPGTFPYWVDVDSKEIREGDPDPVAAARFVEALLEGELGLPEGAEKAILAPPTSSTFGWVAASDFRAGEPFSAFVGRGSGKVLLLHSGAKVDSKSGTNFAKCERLDVQQRGVKGMMFHTPGQVLCLGNSNPSPARFTVNVPARAPELSKRLSTALEAYDPARGTWEKVGTVRVSATLSFDASVEPGGWNAYRVATN
jgi:hypothetical protein